MSFRDRMASFMSGRYGMDSFSRFLIGVAFLLIIIELFTRQSVVGVILGYLALALIIYADFRVLSRNTYNRDLENRRFLQLKDRFFGVFRRNKTKFDQRKDYKFFACPNCKQTVRVPKGKGKINISCPKCHTKFVKKS